MTRYEITEADKKLIETGLEVLKQNFDDGVYNHTVGCALLCKNGNIYKGVNCDGIHGSCAEYITMGIAISAGEREFDTIVAVHDKHLNFVLPPCGNCSLPVSYAVYNPEAIAYFEGLEPSTSEPVFTKVWGDICSQEFITTVETKSAFGESLVEERKTTKKAYVVTGASSDCYDWDSEDTILASEVKAAMSNRELHLAEVKKNYEDYQASKGAAAPAKANNVAAGNFAF